MNEILLYLSPTLIDFSQRYRKHAHSSYKPYLCFNLTSGPAQRPNFEVALATRQSPAPVMGAKGGRVLTAGELFMTLDLRRKVHQYRLSQPFGSSDLDRKTVRKSIAKASASYESVRENQVHSGPGILASKRPTKPR